MGCVQSKSAQEPVGGVLPTSVKVANSTKTGVAPGNPAVNSNANDPIYLDRADTWGGQRTETPSDNSAAFQIKSEGNRATVASQMYMFRLLAALSCMQQASTFILEDLPIQAMRVCKST